MTFLNYNYIRCASSRTIFIIIIIIITIIIVVVDT